MRAKASPLTDASVLLRLLAILPAEMVGDAMKLAAERLKLTPAKLSLLLVRAANPTEELLVPEIALLHGVSEKTYRGMRERGEV